MCGIVGYANLDFSEELFKSSVQTLSHRGPNHLGFEVDLEQEYGLGHTRLSILDLNPRANQPMFSRSGRYVIVFNGEIYNFRELALKYDLTLTTSSDTEVILELFELKGKDFIKECNGMFSIVIFDKKEKFFHLFRDRMGIKPLYYFLRKNEFVFGSELKAIKKLIPNLTPNKSVIPDFLQLGYIPSPSSFHQNVHKFPQASYGLFDGNHLIISKYWEIDKGVNHFYLKSEVEAKEQLSSLIQSSVKYRMISDVSVGSFLSGGIDSSTVTAFAKEQSSKQLKTFTIGFKDSKFDERKHASQISKHLDTDHHEFVFSEKELIEKVDGILDVFDEPFTDSSCFPTMLVSEIAKKHVTVVLSGDGGDEQFLGYNAYKWAGRLGYMPLYHSRHLFAKALKLSSSNRADRVSSLLSIPSKKHFYQHIFSQEQYLFSRKELGSLLVDEADMDLNQIYENDLENPIEKQALFDLKYYLPDDLLVKVDRSSMQHALEVRVPLLDHRIIEFTQNLHHTLKLRKGESKYLLKKVLFEKIPEKYFQHPKWGFGIPLGKWLSRELSYLIDKYLSKGAVEGVNVFHYSEVLNYVNRFRKGEDHLYNRVWAMILIQKSLID